MIQRYDRRKFIQDQIPNFIALVLYFIDDFFFHLVGHCIVQPVYMILQLFKCRVSRVIPKFVIRIAISNECMNYGICFNKLVFPKCSYSYSRFQPYKDKIFFLLY